MVVIFYRTTAKGQEEAGRITYDGTDPQPSNEYAGHLMAVLLEGVDPKDRTQVAKALRAAPGRFDGSYLRAALEDDRGGPD